VFGTSGDSQVTAFVEQGRRSSFSFNRKGVTALHLMLKKNSPPKHVEMLMRHRADPTIRSKDRKSPLDLVAKRRDKTYLNLLSRGAASRP